MTSEVTMPVVAWRNPAERSLADAFEWDIPRRSPAYSEALVKESDALAAIEAARVEARAKALEEAAQQWDECFYDSPGESIDIGAAIRSLAKEAP